MSMAFELSSLSSLILLVNASWSTGIYRNDLAFLRALRVVIMGPQMLDWSLQIRDFFFPFVFSHGAQYVLYNKKFDLGDENDRGSNELEYFPYFKQT